MQAVILAGGKGTRLRPYTTVIPKPLMPIGDLPILEIILRQLKHAGIQKIIMAVGYLPHLFEAVIGDGKSLGLSIEYSREKDALGTAGPLANLAGRLEDDFLVMNGDVLTTLKFDRFVKAHLDGGTAASICTFRRDVKIDFGVIQSENGLLSRYIEKPTYHYEVSMGINMLKKRDILQHLQPGQYLDMPDLLMKVKESGGKVQTLNQDCLWLDIGRQEDYVQALDIFESRKQEFLP